MKSKSRWIQILVFLAAAFLIVLARTSVLELPAPESILPTHHEQQANEQLYWGNLGTLQDHFQRHGADFLAKDREDYAWQAHTLYMNRGQYQMKEDNDGSIRIYDAATNAFGAYNADGTTKTYFKPDNGQAYFDRQSGKLREGW